MLVAFADNLTLTLVGTGFTNFFTDAVPIGRLDRVTAISNVHAIGATAGFPQLDYIGQVSDDGGQSWVNTSVGAALLATGIDRSIGLANGALLRFQFAFQNPVALGTDVSFITFDLHVHIDHA